MGSSHFTRFTADSRGVSGPVLGGQSREVFGAGSLGRVLPASSFFLEAAGAGLGWGVRSRDLATETLGFLALFLLLCFLAKYMYSTNQ